MICASPGCRRTLKRRGRKYCSHACANQHIAQRGLAFASLPEVQAELTTLSLKAFPTRPRLAPKRPAGDLMVEVNVTDNHVGKLAWSPETGFSHYDTKIAIARHDAAIDAILARTAHLPVAKFILVVGSDLLHADTIQGTTTKGTQLDTDARLHKVFNLVLQMEMRAIEKLRARAEVEVIGNPGNHDRVTAFALVACLEMAYRQTSDVTVSNAPTNQKYVQWGQVMLMIAHGDKGKLAEYPQVMALERPQMWAATTHREAHVGHLHQEKGLLQSVQEFKGAKVRVLPALCPPDAFHADEHYIGKLESAQAFIWSKSEGLIGIVYYTVPPHQAEAAA